MRQEERERLKASAPMVHCITNPVTMGDVANLLLAAGGSAIMAQDPGEVGEVTVFCHATLLNLGVPNEAKYEACILAGRKANELGHPVTVDPVGVGASRFRQRETERLLSQVRPTIIRCNQEEACALLHMKKEGVSGGVESSVTLGGDRQGRLAESLARMYGCAVLVSGASDAVSDGERLAVIEGGDARITRITGSGCMLSALCALFAGAGLGAFESACAAAELWKRCAQKAGRRADAAGAGIGSFRTYLFDEIDRECAGKERDI